MEQAVQEQEGTGAIDERINELVALYPETGTKDEISHGKEHITAVLDNLTRIKRSEEGFAIPDKELSKAKLAVALHDLQRHTPEEDSNTIRVNDPGAIEGLYREKLADTSLAKEDVDDIVIAIKNHNKPKSRWTSPNHLISSLVYDADKMDTTPDRFIAPLDPESDPDGKNATKFNGYIIMVRDSATYPVAKERLTKLLPPELQINPLDQTQSAENVAKYYESMHRIWEETTMPGKKTAAKYCLQCTGNSNFARSIQEAYGPKTEIESLSPLKRRLVKRVEAMESTTAYSLDHLEELIEKSGSSTYSKEKIALHLSEKLFTYDTFSRAIANYPQDHEEDLEKLYFRQPELLHKNYLTFSDSVQEEKQALGEAFETRSEYFKQLSAPRLNNMRHYTREASIDEMVAGKILMDKEFGDILADTDTASMPDAIASALASGDSTKINDILRFFNQDTLRAVDRVNDVMATDRFIYFLLEGQNKEAPVRRLPYIFNIDEEAIEAANLPQKVNYSSPTHPQTIHAIKLHNAPTDMVKTFQESIAMYTRGLYQPDDFHALYTDIFSLTCSLEEVSKELFDFIFNNVIVNEDSKLEKTKDNESYVAPGWIDLDYATRDNPLWKKGNTIVSKINAFCAEHAIIPPLRPYAVVEKKLELQAVGATMSRNPEAN